MAMLRKNNKSQPEEGPRVLDVTAAMQGELTFKDPVNLRISGKFEGNLDTRGELEIGEKAVVKANINGDIIRISGTVQGDIISTVSLSFSQTAKFNGTLNTPLLEVEKGAIVNGTSNMGGGTAKSTTMSTSGSSSKSKSANMTIEEVAQYLEIEQSLVKTWAEKGKIPAEKVDKEWLFDKNQVDEWIVSQK